MAKRPSNAWYALAGAFLVAGIVVFVWLLGSSVTGMSSGLQRGVVPGQVQFQLDEPGTYVIFHEYQSVIDGKVYNSPAGLPPLIVKVVAAGAGTEMPVQAATVSSTYTYGSRSGRSMLSFEAPQAGAYTLTAAYQSGAAGPQVVLAVGRGMGFEFVFSIMGAIASLLVGGALAVLTAVITFVRQRQATRA